ncbi:MAG: hypothetical protein AAGD22_16040 [Verrucomicrobiota bacterium]
MKAFTFFLLCFLAVATLATSQYLIFAMPDAQDFGVSLLVGATGLIVGSFVGLIASPFASDIEKDRFHSRTTALVGLILGYLVARVTEPIMDRLFDVEGGFEFPSTGHNTLLLIATTLFGFIFGYVYRQFLPMPKPSTRVTAQSPIQILPRRLAEQNDRILREDHRSGMNAAVFTVTRIIP